MRRKKILDLRRYLVEIKIGVFLLGAMIIIFLTTLSLREVSFLRGSYIVKVKFDFAEGLRPSSPVRLCGVDVGEIKRVEVKEEGNNTVVYVYAKIERGIKIPKDSYFFINNLSLFGEKYLEIIPAQPHKKKFLKENQLVIGTSSTPLFNIMDSFYKTMKKLDEFIREEELRSSLKSIVINLKGASQDLKEILRGIKDKEGSLGKFIYDDSLYLKTEELIEDLKAHPWKLLHKPKERKPKKRRK